VTGLRFPHWEPDTGFDLDHHVRRAALPAPGGASELLEWAGDFYSHRLDRARPLWKIVILEGLAGDRWALAIKTHHCLVDGVGSIDAGSILLDTSKHVATEHAQPVGRQAVAQARECAARGFLLQRLDQCPQKAALDTAHA